MKRILSAFFMIRSIFIIYPVIFSFRLGFQATQPLVSLYFLELGVDPSTIGLLLGAAGIVPVLLAGLFGRLADRFGPTRQVLFGSLASVLGYLMLTSTTSPLLVTFYLMIAWLGTFATSLAYQKFIADHVRTGNSIQRFAWLSASISLANILAPVGAGFIADKLSLISMFYLAAAFSSTAIFGLPLMSRMIKGEGIPAAADKWQETNQINWSQNPTFRFTISSVFLTGIVMGIRNTFLPLYVKSLGMSIAEIGGLISIQAIAGIATQSQLGRIENRHGSLVMIVAAFTLAAPALSVIPIMKNFAQLIVPMVLLGLSSGVLHPATMAMAANSVPAGQQGTALGLRYTSLRLGSMGSPLIFGIVAGIAGLPAVFASAAAISILGAIGSFLAKTRGVLESGSVQS